jgi:hypothetical protein
MKQTILLLFLLIVTNHAFGGAGTFPQGDHVKQLKDKIEFKNTLTQIISNDADDPTSVAKSADEGSIYIQDGVGDIFIKRDSGSSINWNRVLLKDLANINDISDITITSAATGEILQWNGSAWVNHTIDGTDLLPVTGAILKDPTGFDYPHDNTISFIDGTRTFTIAPTGASFALYVQGVLYSKTSESIVIPDVEGNHYIYYDASGVLTSTQTMSTSLITDYAFVSNVYWDATNSKSIVIIDERHGYKMDGTTHLSLHNGLGSVFRSGLGLSNFTIGNGSLDSHAQFSMDDGLFYDEDLPHTVTNGAPQTLSPIANAPILYKSGATGVWRYDAISAFPVQVTGTGRGAWNEWTGATWQVTESVNLDYVLAHVFATNDIVYPMVIIMGEANYSTLSDARAGAAIELGNLATNGLPTQEYIAVGTIILQTSNTYANTVKSRVVEYETGFPYIDFRTTKLLGNTASDHGNLTGLADDDHTQYSLLAGRTGGQTIIGGTGASENLTLTSTSDVTKGVVAITGNGTVGGTLSLTGEAYLASDLRFSATDLKLYADTSDGSDTKSLTLTGAGDALTTRGASFTLFGNEQASTGDALLSIGEAGKFRITGVNDTDLVTVDSVTGLTRISNNIEALNKNSETIAFMQANNVAVASWQAPATATLGEETTNFLSGTKSYKLTNVTGSSGDFTISPSVSVTPSQVDREIGVKFEYTYDGANDDISAQLYYSTDGSTFSPTGLKTLLEARSTSTPALVSGHVPSNAVAIELVITVEVVNNGKILVFDDVEFTKNPLQYKNMTNLTEWESFIPVWANFTIGNGTQTNFKWRRVGDSIEISGTVTLGSTSVIGTSPSFALPNGLIADVSESDFNSGLLVAVDLSVPASRILGKAFILSSALSDIRLGTAETSFSSTTPFTWATGDYFDIDRFSVPIVGWSAQSEHVVTPQNGTRTYSQANGDFTISDGAVSWATVYSSLIPYKDQNGNWRLKGNFNGTHTSSTNVTPAISGVAFPAQYQAVSVYTGTDVPISIARANPSSNTFYIRVSTGTSPSTWVSFDVALASKPTWASDVTTTYMGAVPTERVAYLKDKLTGAAGSSVATSWQTRRLQSLEGDTSFISLVSNQFTLEKGRYLIQASAPAYKVDYHKIILRDIAASSGVAYSENVIGTDMYSSAADSTVTKSVIDGFFEINTPTTFEIQHYTSAAHASGLGVAVTSPSVYTQVKITKLR